MNVHVQMYFNVFMFVFLYLAILTYVFEELPNWFESGFMFLQQCVNSLHLLQDV